MKLFAIIRNEIRQRRWSLLWWSVAVAAFIALNLAFYPSFKDQAAEAEKAFANIPDSLKALFTDTGDFLSPIGFLSSQIYYLLLPLLLGMLAIGMGAGLIAKEEKRGTLELLLARPVSRGKLLAGKALAGTFILLTVGFVAMVVTVLSVTLTKLEVSRKGVILTTLVCISLSLLLGAVAFMFSALGRPARAAAIGLAALLGFGSYIISSLAGTVQWLEWPAKAMPFYYYRPAEILGGLSSGGWTMLAFCLIALLLFIVAWLGFRRRDIG